MRYLLIFSFIILYKSAFSQVYNYLPLSLRNIESNPAYVASYKNNFSINATHLNNFSNSENFNYSTFRISKNIPKLFSGIGLTAASSTVYDSTKYQYLGISFAYRNILFNKAYVLLGICYKFIDTNAPNGYFSKFNYIYIDSLNKNDSQQNTNISLTISSAEDSYYLVAGWLNVKPFFLKTREPFSQFPTYFYVRFGNLWRIFSRFDYFRISYMFSNEINGLYKGLYYNSISISKSLRINRKSILRYGGSVGINSERLWNIRPGIIYSMGTNWLKRGRNRRRLYESQGLILKLSADISFAFQPSTETYNPVYQFSIIYQK